MGVTHQQPPTERHHSSTGGDLRPLDKAWKLLNEFAKIKDKMPLQHARAFIWVAMHEGCTQDEIQEACGMAQSAVSRFVDDWHPGLTKDKEPGFGLVEGREDENDRRVLRYHLTRKGKAYRDTISTLMEV